MPTLPPIPQESWDQHVDDQFNTSARADLDALDAGRQAQQQADQARVQQDAREDADFNASARADLEGLKIAQARNQEDAAFNQQARADLDRLRQPVVPAMPPTATSMSPPVTSTDVGGTDWRAYAAQAAQKAGIDPALFQRQIQQESGFDPNAKSGAGALGIAQIVPSAHPGVNPLDPKAALDYAATWMRQLTDRYGGDVRKALAAYNAGPGAVDKYGGVPPFEETQRYVRAIADEGQQADVLGPPPSPGPPLASGPAADPMTRATSVPRRAEAVGQFEQGLPYDEAAAICGPVAALAFAQSQGRNPDLAEARALAKQVGWTSTGGMNGVANEQALLTRLGVKSRLDTNPDFGVIAHDASSGNPVIISTPVHYYYASAYDPNTGKVFVGKTGTSRKGGGSWMTPAEIATLDGGINGALFVDNPQSPTPSVGADPMASGEGDRPASEFETPPPEEIPRRLGPESIAPTDLSRIGIDVPVPGPSEIRSGARRVADTVGAGIDWAGEGLVDNVQKFSADQEELARLSLDRARAAHRGETLPPDQEQRLTDLSSQYGLALTGEPLASTGGRAASAAGEGVLGAAKRFFHGTGSAFDRPEAARFDPEGLYGPGYYLTSEPRVADSYAAVKGPTGVIGPDRLEQIVAHHKAVLADPNANKYDRQVAEVFLPKYEAQLAEASRVGPNVRAVDVPEGLHLLDAEAPATVQDVRRVAQALPEDQRTYFLNGIRPYVAEKRLTGHDLHEWVQNATLDPTETNRVLAAAGYDGVRYAGGKRIPMTDEAGQPIEHTAVAVFPESVGKLRNAISGTAGGIVAPGIGRLGPPGMPNLAGLVAGGVIGYESSPDTDTTQQRLERIGAGALLGATGVAAARGELSGPARRVLGARQGVLPGAADVPTTGRATNLIGETRTVGAPQPSLYDRFQTVRFAGMLSSTATQILNNTANAVNTLADVGMKPLQALIDAGVSAGSRRVTIGRGGVSIGPAQSERTRYLAEVAPQAKAFVSGLLTGAQKIPAIMRTGVDPETAGALDLPRGGLRSGSKAVDTIVEAPLRALSAADAMFRGAAYAGHAAALATRQAIKEGLTGAERAARVDHILSNLHEFKSIDDEASKLAARAVFQEHRAEIDPVIKALKQTKLKYVSDLVLPFIRTPYNVAAQGVGMTPVGLVGALKAAKAGQRGEAIDRAVRGTIGTAALGYGFSLASAGYITGASPDDAAERSTLPDGWKPYSLRIPVQDGAVYVPLQMLGPIAMPLGIAAALADLSRKQQAGADPETLAYRGLSTIAKYAGNQAFLQGLSALPNIIDDPERYLSSFTENLASSTMPYSGLQKQVDQFLGRAPRDPKGALQGFLAASPLTSPSVDARLTPLGEERQQPSGPAALVTGTRIGVEGDDAVLRAFRDARVTISAPPKEVFDIPLTPAEQRRVQIRAGQLLRERVADWATDPEFLALPIADRGDILEHARDQAREDAAVEVLDPLPDEEIARRRGLTDTAKAARQPAPVLR